MTPTKEKAGSPLTLPAFSSLYSELTAIFTNLLQSHPPSYIEILAHKKDNEGIEFRANVFESGLKLF